MAVSLSNFEKLERLTASHSIFAY